MQETVLKLDEKQLLLLHAILSKGSDDASRAMSKWLRRGVEIRINEVKQAPFQEAAELLGDGSNMITACVMNLAGQISGRLVVALDDPSGLALTDLLMGNPVGTATEWTEIERSAAAETTNILGCAYLNSLSTHLPPINGEQKIYPSPPELCRDYAASLFQALFMEQMMVSDQVLLVLTEFARHETHLKWNMLLLPDLESFAQLATTLEYGH